MKDIDEAISYLVIKFAELEDAIHHLMAEVRKNNPPPFAKSYEKATEEKLPEQSPSQKIAAQMLKTKTQISGEFCTCGGLLVQTGTCKTCQSCGNNAGCG